MTRCSALTRDGRECPIVPTFLDDYDDPWCHVHADRAICRRVVLVPPTPRKIPSAEPDAVTRARELLESRGRPKT